MRGGAASGSQFSPNLFHEISLLKQNFFLYFKPGKACAIALPLGDEDEVF